MKKKTKKSTRKKRRRMTAIQSVCWIAIPVLIMGVLFLDGLGFYTFNTERILVLCAGVLTTLLPFFSEITIKNFSFKKDDKQK